MLRLILNFTSLILILQAFQACSNGVSTPSSTSFRSSASTSATLPTSTSEGAFTVSKVMKSNQGSETTLDLLGVNGEFGTYCASASACACRFNWTDSSGNFHEVDQVLGYVETNLARCLYTSVDSNIAYFDIKLVVTAGNVTSNTTRVYVGAVNPSFDPTNKYNFVQIARYLCMDHVGATTTDKTNLYSGLVDPRLWIMSYSYNLYTYSLGIDYGAVKKDYLIGGNTSKTVKEFECPPTPNDTSYTNYPGVATNLSLDLQSIDKINLTNPLLVNQGTGDNTIYPSTDNLNNGAACVNGTEANCEQFKINRHDFYLASFQDGTFKEPVCIRHTVANLTQVYNAQTDYKCSVDTTKGPAVLGSAALVGGNYPGGDIIGFGAHPDSNQNCPSSTAVAIPTGYKWAKLWLMQAEYPARTANYVSNAGDIGQLYCTSRETECFNGDTTTIGNPAPGDGYFLNTAETAVNSVCWSMLSSSPSGLTVGPQQSYPGYGNCSSTGTAGDNQTPAGGAPATAYRGGNCTALTTVGGSDINFNCCTDVGFISSDPSITFTTQQQIDYMIPANYTSGGNYCNPAIKGGHDGQTAGGKDNWLIGNGNRRACIESDTDSDGALYSSGIFSNTTGDPLTTYQMGTTFIDQNPIPDYLFVVTPTRVTVENMQNPTDPVGLQFTPKRVLPSGSTMIYRFNSQTGNYSTTPGGVPITRLAQYPLCVLQRSQ